MSMHDAAKIGVSDPGSSVGFAAIGQSLLSLVVVVAVILVMGMVIRHFTNGGARSKRHLNVVSSMMVGTKERVVIVEVENTWLVLGVGAGTVNKLHELPKPEGIENPQDEATEKKSFGKRFAEELSGRLKP